MFAFNLFRLTLSLKKNNLINKYSMARSMRRKSKRPKRSSKNTKRRRRSTRRQGGAVSGYALVADVIAGSRMDEASDKIVDKNLQRQLRKN